MVTLGAKNVEHEDDIQGNSRPLAGRYHVVVKEVDESFDRFEKVIITIIIQVGAC